MKKTVTGAAAQQITPSPYAAAARYRAAGEQVNVSFPAVIARINRVLRKQDEQLKKARGDRMRLTLGEYYVLDWRRNFIVRQYVDVEDIARELRRIPLVSMHNLHV